MPSNGPVAVPMRWLPLVVIASAQMLIVANRWALRISIGPIVAEFGTSATSVQSALVVYSLVTAAFMILAAKAGALYGSLPLFRGGVLLLGIALVGAAVSPGPTALILAEGVAGAAAAALLPAVVALIAANYEGSQRVLAIGVVSAAAGSLALLLAGVLGSAVGWRLPFWALAGMAALVLVGSRRLAPSPSQTGVEIDWLGALLSGAAIVLVTVGVNGVASWGLVLAKDAAPLDVFGVSPSLILIVAGIILGWIFFAHQRHRSARGRTPLVSPGVVGSSASRLALLAVFVTLAVSAGYGYLLPLYMQLVQGYDILDTALRMLPYALSLSASAVLAARLVRHFTVRGIVRWGMLLLALGLVVVGAAIQNSWTSAVVLLGLILAGLGTGPPLSLAASVLIGASRPAVASEVGGVRNTASNLGGAVGTAAAGALLILLLSGQVENQVAGSRVLPPELKNRLTLENVHFVDNNSLRGEAAKAGLTEAQTDELVRINTDARLTALRITFFALAALAALGAIAAGRLPDVEERGPPAASTGRPTAAPSSDPAR